MVRCCTNICCLPTKTCEALFENRGNNRDLKELVGKRQCYYICVQSKCEWRREIKKMVVKCYQRSKRFVDLRKLVMWMSIYLLTTYLPEPNKTMSTIISSFKLFKKTSILNKLFSSFFLFSAKNGQRKKKWSRVSYSEPQSHIGLAAS